MKRFYIPKDLSGTKPCSEFVEVKERPKNMPYVEIDEEKRIK